jgi:hypothetical protein
MSDILTIEAGEVWRAFPLVAREDGSDIVTGMVNYYCKTLTGANAGKWWKNSDQTWDATETANAMTHQGDGGWTIQLAASPFADNILYYEYSKESGDLHVAGNGRLVRGGPLIGAIADAILDRTNGVETGKTLRQALRIIAAVLAGKVSGAGTGVETFTGIDGGTERVQVAADSSGNRTAVTYDP